jgi:hypothetical protein
LDEIQEGGDGNSNFQLEKLPFDRPFPFRVFRVHQRGKIYRAFIERMREILIDQPEKAFDVCIRKIISKDKI